MTLHSMRKIALRIIAAAAATAIAGAAPAAAQQDYPARTIRVVIGFPAGAGADVVARFFAARIAEIAGQPVVVENKPGAFSSIAFATVGAAKPDGYTILWTGSSIMAGGRHMVKDLPYDPDRDFVPVAAFTENPFVVTVGAASPAKDLAGLMALLKGKAKNRYGHVNPPAFLATAYFKSRVGFEAEAVAYRGAADAMPDVENGTLDFMITDGAFAVGPIRGGKIRALAATSTQRIAALPDVPTMAEAGLVDFQFNPWWGAWLPAGTSQAIVGRHTAWFAQVAKLPQTAKFLENIAVIPLAEGPAGLGKRIASDKAMWDRLAKEIDLKPQ